MILGARTGAFALAATVILGGSVTPAATVCEWSGFPEAAVEAQAVVVGEVIGHGPQPPTHYPVYAEVRVRRVLRGQRVGKQIRVWGGLGSGSRSTDAKHLPVGTTWVIALNADDSYFVERGEYHVPYCADPYVRVARTKGDGGTSLADVVAAIDRAELEARSR